jgi:CBS domain-containing protein
VRKLNPQARELADMYFFETLVRVHRAGEGEPYTGLKPAGRDLGPAIPAADKALESGKVEALVRVLNEAVQGGVREKFQEVLAKKKYKPDDVELGREYVEAYVSFLEYVERIYGLPVADDEHRLLGMITYTDLLRDYIGREETQ